MWVHIRSAHSIAFIVRRTTTAVTSSGTVNRMSVRNILERVIGDSSTT